jgi:outer membrane protein TolC
MNVPALLLLVALRQPAETLALPALQAEAERRDPRAAQLALEAARSALRQRNLAAERLPRLSISGEGSYQSAVPGLPPELVQRLGGRSPLTPPKDRYQATVAADQMLYDGGSLTRRRGLERARLAEAQAGVRAALVSVRDEVNAAFFAALFAQERDAQLAAAAEALDARLAQLRARRRAGAALPGDTAAVRAELLRLGQQRAEAAADRRSAIAVLGALVGRPLSECGALLAPDLAAAVRAARAAGDSAARDRPEYERFARTRARLAREADVAATATRPRVSAFGQGGYGRPGLNVLGDELQPFAIGGVRVQWPVVDWRASRRDQEALRLQQRTVDTEEAAFRERIARAVQDELAALDRLEGALAVDDTIVALRERVEFEARRQLEEGALTAAEYVSRRNDVTEARLARSAHRVELARARAAYLTTLGVPLR